MGMKIGTEVLVIDNSYITEKETGDTGARLVRANYRSELDIDLYQQDEDELNAVFIIVSEIYEIQHPFPWIRKQGTKLHVQDIKSNKTNKIYQVPVKGLISLDKYLS